MRAVHLLLAGLVLTGACLPTTPSVDMGTTDLATPDDLSQEADLSSVVLPDLAIGICKRPCGIDVICPASIWGVCEEGCCICRPPDGGSCPSE